MRAVNKKLKKTLPGFDLDELMRFVSPHDSIDEDELEEDNYNRR
jgi:hypothetical protein